MKRFISPFFFVVLFGCAQLGIAPADTFNKKVAAAYETVAAIADTAYTLRAAGKITAAEKDRVAATNDTALAGIAEAQKLAGTDITNADTRLQTAITLLTAMQAFLATRSQK